MRVLLVTYILIQDMILSNPPTDDEDDYLDKAWGLKPESRLSCQAKVTNEDLIVEIPKYTINHASENH